MPRPVRTPALPLLALVLLGWLSESVQAQTYQNPLPNLEYILPVDVHLLIKGGHFAKTDFYAGLPLTSDPFGIFTVPGEAARYTPVAESNDNPGYGLGQGNSPPVPNPWYETTYTHNVEQRGLWFDLGVAFWDADSGVTGDDDYLGGINWGHSFGVNYWFDDDANNDGQLKRILLVDGPETSDDKTPFFDGALRPDPLSVQLLTGESWNAGHGLLLGDSPRFAYGKVSTVAGGTLTTVNDSSYPASHWGIQVFEGGELNILNGGVVTTDRDVVLNEGGAIRLEQGGRLRADQGFLNETVGGFDWQGGRLEVARNASRYLVEENRYEFYTEINSFNPFGLENSDFAIFYGRELQVNDKLEIGSAGGLIVDYGLLDTHGDVIVEGYLSVNRSGSGILGNFNIAPGKTVTFRNGGYGTFEGPQEYGDGVTLEALAGADLSYAQGFDLRAATMRIDGTGSTLETGNLEETALRWGTLGGIANVTFSNNAQGYLNGDVYLGSNGTAGDTGNLHIESGAYVALDHLNVGGLYTGGAGSLTVTGAGSRLIQNSASAGIVVGGIGSNRGTVNLNVSGLLRTNGSTLTVRKTGTVNINGGTLDANGGHVRFEGGTLNHVTGSLLVGQGKYLTFTDGAQANASSDFALSSGQTMEVLNGSNADIGRLNMGHSGDGTLIVDGPMSSLIARYAMNWGLGGATANATFREGGNGFLLSNLYLATTSVAGTTANLSVETGSTVYTQSIHVAGSTQGAATITVRDQYSLLAMEGDSTLTVGGTGDSDGQVKINNYGQLHTGAGLTTINPTGLVTIGDGVFSAAGDVNLNGGTVALTRNDSEFYAETVRLNAGTFTFDGGTLGVDRFEGDLDSHGGKISPGRPHAPSTTELTTIVGNFADTFGSLFIELGGVERGTEYDALSVTGDVALSTALEISLVGGFELRPGQAFTILEVGGLLSGGILGLPEGGLIGTFNDEPLWGSFSGGDGNDIVLYTSAPLAGDYNGDGLINTEDYASWRNSYGTTIMPGYGADGNGDGNVDAADYTVWRDNVGQPAGTLLNDPSGVVIGSTQYDNWAGNFGATASSSTATSSIPEPTTLLLALLSLGVQVGRRKSLR